VARRWLVQKVGGVGVKRSAIIVGLVVLTSASGAWANSSGSLNVTGTGSSVFHVQSGALSFGEGSGMVNTPSGGGDYNAFVQIDSSSVTFESADSVSGAQVTARSTSSVTFTIVNDGSQAITPVFRSTIVPAGLGFYLADTSSGCGGDIFTGCAPTSGPRTFADLRPAQSFIGPGGLASSSFDFRVLSDGSSIYDLAGSMRLNPDGSILTNLGQASTLNGFGLASPAGSQSNVGYTWGETSFMIDTLTPLAPGASRTITYQVAVNTTDQTGCLDGTTCLIAYAGFGDPVGTGSGINNAVSALSLLQGLGLSSGSGDGLTFTPATFNLPTFNNGVLTFTIQGVPEPGTWITMLLGTALMGAMLRRSRQARLAA
jgi:hypothetical protein